MATCGDLTGIVKPDATNTGPNNPELIPGSASTHPAILVDGTVVENKRIVGGVFVRANNVTFRNCIFENGDPFYCIRQNVDYAYNPPPPPGGYTGMLVEYCEFTGATSKGTFSVQGTIRYCHFHHIGDDAIFMRYPAVIERNYMHHLGDLSLNPTAHGDGIQWTQGSDSIVRYNNIDMPNDPPPSGHGHNACVIMEPSQGPIDGNVIESNWLNGGNYTVYFDDVGAGNGPPTNCVLRNNRFGREYQFGPLVNDDTSATIALNAWDDTGECVDFNTSGGMATFLQRLLNNVPDDQLGDPNTRRIPIHDFFAWLRLYRFDTVLGRTPAQWRNQGESWFDLTAPQKNQMKEFSDSVDGGPQDMHLFEAALLAGSMDRMDGSGTCMTVPNVKSVLGITSS